MALQFNVDLRLLNGLFPAVFWPLFPICNFALFNICFKHFHIPSYYPHILSNILLHRLGIFHSVWLFRSHNSGSLTVSFFTVKGCRSVAQPQPGESVHRIYKPRGRVTQLYPQAPGTHFGSLLRPAWAAAGPFFSPITTRGIACTEHTQLQTQRSRIKTMLIIFFYSQGVMHKEIVPDEKSSKCTIL